MGIQGLLPLLKSIQVNTHLSQFKGQTLAVDGYVLLHRGVYACTPQLIRGEPTTKYVEYVLHRVRMMRHHGVKPYIVFDGGPLPAKKHTESDRSKKRAENLARANKLTEQGLHAQARELLTRCIDVTPEMAAQVIKGLKHEGVPYVVAPYEADAQLAYLERAGVVDGVITEDSDLLVFGCKNVVFKLDSDGNCINIKKEKLGCVKEAPMHGWTDKEFREMAILSGCDYLPSISGLGIKTAHKLMRKYKTVEKVLQYIRLESNMKIPAGYLDAFRIAQLPFLYQRVFDPRSRTVVHLNPLEDCIEWDESRDAYVGTHIDTETGQGIADGSVNPVTLEPMVDINPQYQPHASSSKRPLIEMDRNKPAPSQSTTLKNFFTVLPKSRQSSSQPLRPQLTPKDAEQRYQPAGASSGRRTLSEQMDVERARKRQREAEALPESMVSGRTTSKFFPKTRTTEKRKREEMDMGAVLPAPFTPRQARRARTSGCLEPDEAAEKENQLLSSAQFPNLVQQEEGYQSPTGSSDIIEVSSPVERLSITVSGPYPETFLDAEKVPLVSSPAVELVETSASTRTSILVFESPTKGNGPSQIGVVLVLGTPESSQPRQWPFATETVDPSQSFSGSDDADQSFQSAGGPFTPNGDQLWDDDKVDFEVDDEAPCVEDLEITEGFIGHSENGNGQLQEIMAGWRHRWSHLRGPGSSGPKSSSALPIPVADDVFGNPGVGQESPSSDHDAMAAPVTKFKRRKPMVGRAQSARNDVARSEGGSRQMRTEGPRSLLFNNSFEDTSDTAPSNLSQRLQGFRYVPA